VAQRSIEVFIGRLITDEAFRGAFIGDPTTTIRAFIDAGHELTTVEIAALVGTGPDLWERVADQVDPRLQKASFQPLAPKG
jgi:hypothetical protein